MTTVLLIRHGRTSANTAGVLAGRSSGVELDDLGRTQVSALGERVAGVRVDGQVGPLRELLVDQSAGEGGVDHPIECAQPDRSGQPV